MRERNIETYLRDRVREVGGWAPKWTSPGNNGVPDRIVFLPGGRVVFVELKAPGKKPTALQLHQHKRLRDLGQLVAVVDSREKVDSLLQYHEEGFLEYAIQEGMFQ
jgi:hypothetical protein